MKTNRLIVQAGAMVLALAVGHADDQQHMHEVAAKSGAKLELVFPKNTYQIGEPIEVRMKYTCTSAEPPIAAMVVLYDRGGRIMDFGFRASGVDGQGASDPLKYLLMSMGGIRGTAAISPEKPYEQKAVVNEWLTFPKPGEYDITSFSGVLFETDTAGEHGPRIDVASTSQKIRIVPADPEWQKQVISSAREKLKGSAEEARGAIKSLRYLIAWEAMPLLVDGLNRQETMFDAFCGLASLPDQQKVKDALLKRLESNSPPPADASWSYTNLLSNADIMAANLDRASGDEATQKQIGEIGEKWRAYFAAKILAGANGLPPDQAAIRLVDAMATGGLRGPSLEQKKLILQNVRSLDPSRMPYVIDSAFGDPELISELSAVAADDAVPHQTRSAVLVQLHKLGVKKFRDAIAEDLMIPQPVFSTAAHLSIGDYRAKEIGKALLKNAKNDKFEVRIKAAETIRDFGVGLSADQLAQLIADLRAKNRFNSPELVEALALASPKAVLPLLREILAGQVKSENDFRPIAVTLIARLPNTEKEVRKELAADETRRERMVQELLQSAWFNAPPESLNLSPSSPYHRIVPGGKEIVATYAPDLLRLASSDPSDKVRTNVAMALHALTGFPAQTNGGRILASQISEYLPQWQEWIAKHGNR